MDFIRWILLLKTRNKKDENAKRRNDKKTKRRKGEKTKRRKVESRLATMGSTYIVDILTKYVDLLLSSLAIIGKKLRFSSLGL